MNILAVVERMKNYVSCSMILFLVLKTVAVFVSGQQVPGQANVFPTAGSKSSPVI